MIDWKIVLKAVTGIIVVPIAILANSMWPWWTQASMPVKILTGPFILPIVGLAYITGFWWNSL
jgi:hypothetical protein